MSASGSSIRGKSFSKVISGRPSCLISAEVVARVVIGCSEMFLAFCIAQLKLHCMSNEPHNEGISHCESSLFNNEGIGAHCSNNEPNNEPPARFWEIISPWEMPNCGCTSTVRVNLGSKLTRTVLIFSIVDISRGDILSRNLGSLFPKANALIVEQ